MLNATTIKRQRVTHSTFILFFILFFTEVRSQYSIAGTAGAINIDIIPDTLLFPPQPQSNALYYIDINQDGMNDIKIDAILYYSNVYTDQRISVSSLNSNTSFMIGGYQDTTWYGSPLDTFMVSNSSIFKLFNIGDTIQNGIYDSSGLLAINYSYVPLPPAASWMRRNMEWLGKGDKFFGVKYQTSSDTSYGWVKVNVTGYNKVLIEEFSLGISGVGINSISFNNLFSIYPNPAIDKMYLLQNLRGEMKISLFDVYGKQAGTTLKSSNQNTEINLCGLRDGIYFIQVTTEEETLTKKIIVKR